MHEVGLAEPVLRAALARAGDRPVAALRVRVGVLHRVVEEAFAQALAISAAGTALDGARLELVAVPVEVSCRDCGTTSASPDPLPACPHCGGVAVDVRGGDELVLELLRYREV